MFSRNRARFSYDDLFELFECGTTEWCRSAAKMARAHSGSNLSHHAIVLPSCEVAFLVARLQDVSVLHDDAQAPGKMQSGEQFLKRGGEQLRVLDLAAEFRKNALLIWNWIAIHDAGAPFVERDFPCFWCHHKQCEEAKSNE